MNKTSTKTKTVPAAARNHSTEPQTPDTKTWHFRPQKTAGPKIGAEWKTALELHAQNMNACANLRRNTNGI